MVVEGGLEKKLAGPIVHFTKTSDSIKMAADWSRARREWVRIPRRFLEKLIRTTMRQRKMDLN